MLRLLAKRPEDRPASAREVGALLAAIPLYARSARRRLLAKAVAVAVLLGLVGFAAVWIAPIVWRPPASGTRDGSPMAPLVPFQPCHFAPQVAYAVGLRPYAVAVGDFDGDGKPDLVLTYWDRVAVFLNNGDGTLRRGVDLAADSTLMGVAVGDFNGDGVLDLAVSQPQADRVSVYLGRGDGTFREPRSYAAGSLPRGVAVGDFDGDGKPDLAIACTSGKVGVLLGNGDGTFRPAAHYPSPQGAISVAVADFNGDGRPNLVTSNGSGDTVRVFLGHGDGTFRPGVPYPVGSGPGVVVVADFNGDGKPDLAVANFYGGNVSVLLNRPPTPHFRLGSRFDLWYNEPVTVTVTALDSHGNLDTHYVGTIHAMCSDSQAEISHNDHTLKPEDNGVWSLGVKLKKTGVQTLTVVDQENGSRLGTITTLVKAGRVEQFCVSAPPECKAGVAFRVTILAQDNFETQFPDYVGTVRVISSDPKAVLPPDYKVVPDDQGACGLPLTLRTPGEQTITVTDTAKGQIVGRATVRVAP